MNASNNNQGKTEARKGRGLWVGMLLLTLASLAGGGAWYYLRAAPTEADAAEAAVKPALYRALEPAFVVNLADEDATRYMQAEVIVMTRDPKALEALERHDPLIRNRLLLLFGQQRLADLQSRADKERLQDEALGEVRAILTVETGDAGVEALYFTSLVTQ